MYQLLMVCVGGALGAGTRHLVNLIALRALGPSFPWGTFIVNIAGSFAMGLLIGIFAQRTQTSPELRLLLTTGLLGGFTTFSAYALDIVALMERKAPLAAAGYMFGSVGLAVMALIAGLVVVRAVSP
ncbi:MAG: fluoride efflux transporter CrcB [Pseudomonadota bacterium]